ncbi:hypothetical protein ACLOJK_003173 [Asimina triloba]
MAEQVGGNRKIKESGKPVSLQAYYGVIFLKAILLPSRLLSKTQLEQEAASLLGTRTLEVNDNLDGETRDADCRSVCRIPPMSNPGVQLQIQEKYVLIIPTFTSDFPLKFQAGDLNMDAQVVIDNGILQLKLLKPEGIVTAICYNGINNLLEVQNVETNRSYWDCNWNQQQTVPGIFERLVGTRFQVILEDENQVEVSFLKTWDPSLKGTSVPLNVDKRFVVLRGSSGFYSYAILEHLEGWHDFSLHEARIVFNLRKDKFHYMAISDNRQRFMPLPDDRDPPRGKPLELKEAVLLVDPIEPEFKGEVDDKYQYSAEDRDLKVHGWICFNPAVGFWLITPSDEFRTGGPLKQNLTSHVGPFTLAMFVSDHYARIDLVPTFTNGEPWKKVLGPVFVYLNSGNAGDDPFNLWEDAKTQRISPLQIDVVLSVVDYWLRIGMGLPFLFFLRYVSEDCIPADSAYVGLALPGAVGSWQRECKGYQFWTKADIDGYFTIKNIRTGDYNLYAFVTGFIGDYKNDEIITITEGCFIYLGDLVFEPPRDGLTLWEIGIPDRSAGEFYVPDANPMYINKLFVDHPDKFRQWGLWERYADLYPESDLVYTVGESDYQKDWFYAQVTRKIGDNKYQATTWQIKFELDTVDRIRAYKLRVAIASATYSELQVRFNDSTANPPHFTTGEIGKDNSIGRHGVRGLYWLFNIDVPTGVLVEGDNTIFLTQAKSTTPFQGILYDYIRLEGPADPNFKKKTIF